ncbi:MAG: FadR family transcriptional regulator [Lentisphaerae bacterium]|nr:MAG: FadR family transcriptional regulator [Lentisphaerota bacterium]
MTVVCWMPKLVLQKKSSSPLDILYDKYDIYNQRKEDNMERLLQRVSTAEAVVNYFKQQIAEGKLHKGDQLPCEKELQQELGISRFALREGLARLRALGIISIAPGKGAVINGDVNPVSLANVFFPLRAGNDPKYIDDLFVARNLIEIECSAMAATNWEQLQLDEMDELLDQLHEALGDSTRYAKLDYRFHHLIVRMANNIFLDKIHELLHSQLQELILQTVRERQHRVLSLQWHQKIAAAIRQRDGETARERMRGHLRACRDAYCAPVHKHGEAGEG